MDERKGRSAQGVGRGGRRAGLLLTAALLASACGGAGTQPPPPPPPAAVIVVQPADQTVGAGSTAIFTVSATGAVGYQWQRSPPGGATFADVSGATAASHTTPVTALTDDGARYRVVVSGAASSVTSGTATLTVTSLSVLPPDPATVAPPVDPTVATDLFQATAFLYGGASPIQSGVVAGAIEPRRVAVLRGRVLDRAGAVVSGVEVSVLGHAELGRTFSRADGAFDLAVNGGSQLVVRYQKDGFLPAQRALSVPWRDYAWLPEVALVPLDAAVTSVDLAAATGQVARGSAMSDASGSRQAALIFAPGTAATMVLAGGATQPLTTLHVRATEFTVGSSGPKAMPATLPPSSGYTYAVELSVDEALAAGATEVRFNQPVPVYLENFLGFPVGSPVPAGHYDRQVGQWVPSANGRVIQVLSITAGQADLDGDGDGLADDAPRLAALGVTPDERARLASLYAAGQTLWRIPVQHFSPWDFNWPFGPPADATAPPAPSAGDPPMDSPTEDCGSIIGCETQSLGEAVPVAGTPWQLHYRSQRTPGRLDARTLDIRLTGATPPAALKRIELEVSVAGRQVVKAFAPAPDLVHHFVFDGKDAYGRAVQGPQPVKVRLGYTYAGVYMLPSQRAQGAESEGLFGHFSYLGSPASGDRERLEVTLWREFEDSVGAWDNRALGLGGWSLSIQHAYDPFSHTFLQGDGKQRKAAAMATVISTAAGTGVAGATGDGGPATQGRFSSPRGLAVGPDGSLYVSDMSNARVRRVGPDGLLSTVAGTALQGFAGDGGPATAAQLSSPRGVAVGPDGSLYIADYANQRIRRVDPAGVITTVAGNGAWDFSGDGGPAVAAALRHPTAVAVGPDGSLYIADSENHRVRRVAPDGIITTFAGGGAVPRGDGGPATAASLASPQCLTIGPDGSLYFVEFEAFLIRRVGPDGILSTVAGGGSGGMIDGIPATQASLTYMYGLDMSPGGALYVAEGANSGRIRRIGPEGVITTVAGSGRPGSNADGGPATATTLPYPYDVALAKDGSGFYLLDDSDRVRHVQFVLPDATAQSQLLLTSEDGQELYVIDAAGHHRQTFDTRSGALRYALGYDAAGYLTSITDGAGNVTTIERQGAAPMALVAPGGQRTTLAVDVDGWLTGITDPAGATHALVHSSEGLLQTFTDPRGNLHRFAYDALGRLTSDQDPAGGGTSLARTEQPDGYTVTTTTQLGRTHVYRVQRLPTGEVRRTFTSASGAVDVTSRATDGSEQTTFADGSVLAVHYGPDPRWGLLAPVAGRTALTTPAGHTRTVTVARTALLVTPGDLLSASELGETITDNGAVRTRLYRDDGVTRTFTETSAAGRTTTRTLDALGRIIQVDVPGRDPVAYAYDAKGQLTTITEGIGPARRVTSLAHDGALQLTGVTDPLGRTLGLSYDGAGRPVSLALPGSRTVALASDASGNTTDVTPPGRSTTRLGYTSLDQLASVTPPSVGAGSTATTRLYDADRALLSVTRPDGRVLAITSDSAGRTAALGMARGSVGYSYDGSDRLVGVAAPGAIAAAYGYDGGLVTTVTWSGPVTGALAYSYDDDLRLTGETVNGGALVAFSRDADGLLTAAGDLGLVHDAGSGLLTGATLGGLSDAWTYDPSGRLSGYTSSRAATALYGATFSRDALGRIVEKVETVLGTVTTWGYGYDAAGRLSLVTRDGSPFSSYSYDQNGNRTARTGAVVASAVTDAQDRLVSQGAATYASAASGELQTRTSGGQSTGYDYDELGHLLKVTLPGGSTLDYLVDGEGRRVGKLAGGALVQGFLYQGSRRVVAELDGASALVSRFVYATRLNVPDYLVRGGATYRIITDQLGSPRLVVDVATGAVAQRIDYDEFGRVLTDTNPGFQPFGFAGGLYDAATGLVRFGARDYDAETGRWTAKDPLGFGGGDTNVYAYAHGDPVNFVDPSGLCPLSAYAQQALDYLAGLNPWTRRLRDGVHGVETATHAANDAVDVRDALADPDPASGLTLLDRGLRWLPGLGAYRDLGTGAIDAVVNGPGGVRAARDEAQYGTTNYGEQRQLRESADGERN